MVGLGELFFEVVLYYVNFVIGANLVSKVSLSAFGFLLCEMVQYNQGRVTSIDALNRRLESLG